MNRRPASQNVERRTLILIVIAVLLGAVAVILTVVSVLPGPPPTPTVPNYTFTPRPFTPEAREPRIPESSGDCGTDGAFQLKHVANGTLRNTFLEAFTRQRADVMLWAQDAQVNQMWLTCVDGAMLWTIEWYSPAENALVILPGYVYRYTLEELPDYVYDATGAAIYPPFSPREVASLINIGKAFYDDQFPPTQGLYEIRLRYFTPEDAPAPLPEGVTEGHFFAFDVVDWGWIYADAQTGQYFPPI